MAPAGMEALPLGQAVRASGGHLLDVCGQPTVWKAVRMLRTSCHCGAISVEVMRRPAQITECNCSICRRYGARWAYYPRSSTKIAAPAGARAEYARGEDLHFDHCRRCGCVVLYKPIVSTGDSDRLGINMRLLEDPDALAGIKVRRFDGARSWKVAGSGILKQPGW